MNSPYTKIKKINAGRSGQDTTYYVLYICRYQRGVAAARRVVGGGGRELSNTRHYARPTRSYYYYYKPRREMTVEQSGVREGASVYAVSQTTDHKVYKSAEVPT